MRIIVLLIISGLLLVTFVTNLCYADIFVLLDSQTKEVLSVYEGTGTEMVESDIVISDKQEIVKFPGSYNDYAFSSDITDYKYKNKKLIMNQAKIDAKEKVKQDKKDKDNELKVIEEKMRQTAIDQLEAEGVEFKYY